MQKHCKNIFAHWTRLRVVMKICLMRVRMMMMIMMMMVVMMMMMVMMV